MLCGVSPLALWKIPNFFQWPSHIGNIVSVQWYYSSLISNIWCLLQFKGASLLQLSHLPLLICHPQSPYCPPDPVSLELVRKGQGWKRRHDDKIFLGKNSDNVALLAPDCGTCQHFFSFFLRELIWVLWRLSPSQSCPLQLSLVYFFSVSASGNTIAEAFSIGVI